MMARAAVTAKQDILMKHTIALCLSFAIYLASLAHAETGPYVLNTIKPLQLLTTAITAAPSQSGLLLAPSQSPHHYQLRPSERRALQQADLVSWIGPTMETFLISTISSLPNERVLTYHVAEPAHAEHAGHHHQDTHQHTEEDAHIWLDPLALGEMAQQLATRLGQLRPAAAAAYQRRALELQQQLQQLDGQIRQRLAGGKPQPYLVNHDGYRHFEQRYGLQHRAALLLTPERKPGAGHLARIQQLLEQGEISCVLTEPQWQAGYLQAALEQFGVRQQPLDPMAQAIANNETGLIAFIRQFSNTFLDCVLQ